jgi:hypothetical protein
MGCGPQGPQAEQTSKSESDSSSALALRLVALPGAGCFDLAGLGFDLTGAEELFAAAGVLHEAWPSSHQQRTDIAGGTAGVSRST